MNIYKKGFTLVEMLTVIAILGVIAVFVIVFVQEPLADSRERSVRTDLNQLRAQANILHVDYNSFGVPGEYPDCDQAMFANTEIARLVTSATDKSPNGTYHCAVGERGNSFALHILDPKFGVICVDSYRITSTVMNWQGVDESVLCT